MKKGTLKIQHVSSICKGNILTTDVLQSRGLGRIPSDRTNRPLLIKDPKRNIFRELHQLHYNKEFPGISTSDDMPKEEKA